MLSASIWKWTSRKLDCKVALFGSDWGVTPATGQGTLHIVWHHAVSLQNPFLVVFWWTCRLHIGWYHAISLQNPFLVVFLVSLYAISSKPPSHTKIVANQCPLQNVFLCAISQWEVCIDFLMVSLFSNDSWIHVKNSCDVQPSHLEFCCCDSPCIDQRPWLVLSWPCASLHHVQPPWVLFHLWKMTRPVWRLKHSGLTYSKCFLGSEHS